MVGICFFAPLSISDTELYGIAECEGVFERFGESERDRINKISNPTGRALSLGGLVALGRALNRFENCEADTRIVRDGLGKPRFACGAPYFSIAHAGDLSVAAVSVMGELGVDIERIDQGRDIERIARKFFSEGEQKQFFGADDRVREFYRIWTAKEAMMKLGGAGMISIMSSDSAEAEVSGELHFMRYDVSFGKEDYILTVCAEDEEKIEIMACEGVQIF